MPQVQKASVKANNKQHRQQQAIAKKQRMRILMSLTAVAFIALIVLAFVFRPSSTMEFNYSELPLKGEANAPVKIVEFGDYKCPACQQFSQTIVKQLEQDYISTGDVGLYFVNDTIIGPDSYTAAYAAQSVFHQNPDAFWPYYDAIYRNQGNEMEAWATADYMTTLAQNEKIDVDYDKLRSDIENGTYADEVDSHNKLASQGNVQATPTLFINGEKFEDVFDYEALKKAIEKAKSEAASAEAE
ncbi:protein-disulfide isomerase [Paenibacillus phyllosphaerae]|uniref:Protein-disulfide isomerase n=1 Tax=Paenibacillus phyllosphaerae TaxID=274593 RepID=A0A7W5B0N8_9BACL|nr:thioredoxin domain-containing protein [Paenibacillus phyllosphaerae]MBB3112290.1 protein-disulfide isomerase [Paenibacillus phyllosphaerae]